MSTQASVLYDAPGPKAKARYLIYGALLIAVLIGFIVWAVLTLNANGQFESRIFERLFAANIFNALGDGLLATLKAAVIAIGCALILGMVLAVARLSDHRWISYPATAFVEFFRAVPLLLLMLFLLAWVSTQAPGSETQTRGMFAVVGGLTLYNGSVLAEVFRAGINAVPKGQAEAAYAIGLRKSQVMRLVLVPQGVKFMLPAIISQCVVVLKDTSLGYLVVYPELARQAKTIATYVGSSLWTFALVALIYIAMNSILSLIATWLERRMSRSGRHSAQAVAAAEEAIPLG